MKFRILSGKHHVGRKTYQKDDVFEADTNLAKMFPERFKLLEGNPEDVVVEEKPAEAKKKYKIDHKGGGYYNIIDIATGEYVNEKAIRNDAEAIRVIEEELGGIYVGRPAVGEEE
jgi:hypothetical protein